MKTEREIKIIVNAIIMSIMMVAAVLIWGTPAHAMGTEKETAPELHYGTVLYQDDHTSLLMTEDGNVWAFEGVSMNTYGQPYILNPDCPIGFDLIEVDTYIGVCVNEVGDGCVITDNGEPADELYNYISYRGLVVTPGDIVETINYRILGTDDDIIWRGDMVLHNIYIHADEYR